ncbi:N-acetylmuramoyl-L-alanine amidase, partial [Acaricomes phytoseiuli]|uniref:peptidoglycan recognition protein family protein n=1 Tax=Acaricomes phytoseiuli TaxID=291968 RepID=UPI0022214BF2
MPSLNVLRDGRPGLAGPLCQLGLARDGTVYVIAAGWGNHAGTGTAPGIPRNQGNAYLIGVEMESAGLPPYDWTAAQLDAAPRLGAALERAYLWWLPESQRLQLGHYEYSDAGKIDPAGWPGGMDGLRTQINKALTGAPTTERTWLDMATENDLKAAIRAVLNEKFSRQGGVDGQASIQDIFAWFDATMRSVVRQTATATAQAILSTPIKREGNDGTITLATFLAYSDAN